MILMLARRKERLPLYLRLLQRMEHSKKYPGFLLNNFHNLLRFWQQHYLHKDKDSTCLENVSAPYPAGWWASCGHTDPGPLRGVFGVRGPRLGHGAGNSLSPYHGVPLSPEGARLLEDPPLSPSLSAQSSCISFSYWKETVSILLDPDRQSPSALVSYIDEPYMDIDRDFTEE